MVEPVKNVILNLELLARIYERIKEFFSIYHPNIDGSVLLTQYCSGNKIEKNEMGGNVVRMEAYTGFLWENLSEREHWGDPGVDGRIILRWIFRKWDVGSRSSWLRVGTVGGHL
jgi:hypothetical protein